MAFLMLIETAGNQDFIFATNKLQQNVGASELTHRIGTRFVLQAVGDDAKQHAGLAGYAELATALLNAMATEEYVTRLSDAAETNPFGGVPIEVLVATSGKAVLLVDTRERGETIIQRVTLRALIEAPGAVVRGVVQEIDLAGSHKAAHAQMVEIHKAVNRLRLFLPAPEARFPMLPIIAPCATSGLPAEHHEVIVEGEDKEYLSESARIKRASAQDGLDRVKTSLGGEVGKSLPRSVRDLDDEMKLDWLAVVHADGNGFGKVFLKLADHMPKGQTTAREYCTFYRRLSLSLELAGIAALRAALVTLDKQPFKRRGKKQQARPIIPIVFGGDDLTVVCDGSRAVSFAEEYLKAFEQASLELKFGGFCSAIPELMDPESGEPKGCFGGGAGIAIVKPHHPFHRAYRLAEELTKSAKATKRHLADDSVSGLDFQVVYEDAAADLEKSREGWKIGRDTFVHARPYIVSVTIPAGVKNRDWAEIHRIDILKAAMRTLDDPQTGLPRSQQHALRSALFRGRPIADARLALIRDRYKIRWETFGRNSLFFPEAIHGAGGAVAKADRTRFIDALELIDIGET